MEKNKLLWVHAVEKSGVQMKKITHIAEDGGKIKGCFVDWEEKKKQRLVGAEKEEIMWGEDTRESEVSHTST